MGRMQKQKNTNQEVELVNWPLEFQASCAYIMNTQLLIKPSHVPDTLCSRSCIRLSASARFSCFSFRLFSTAVAVAVECIRTSLTSVVVEEHIHMYYNGSSNLMYMYKERLPACRNVHMRSYSTPNKRTQPDRHVWCKAHTGLCGSVYMLFTLGNLMTQCSACTMCSSECVLCIQ